MDACGEESIQSFQSHIPRLLPIAALLLIGQMLIGCAGEPETSWLGIDIRLGPPPAGSQPASAPATPADGNIDFRLMKELGVGQLRIDLMNWSKIQPTADGRYDFSSSDQIVRLAQQDGIDIMAVCRSVPAWAAANPPTGLPAREKSQAFAAFVRAFVERYDGDTIRDMPGLRRPIRTYECLAEMDSAPTAEYAYWLKLYHETVKGVYPRATVVLGSLTSPGVKEPARPAGEYHTFFERLLTEPALQGPRYPYFDAVGFFSFPRLFPGRPPFEHAVVYLHQTMAARRIDRPLWLTAFGANSNDPHAGGEDRQAADLVCWAIHARTLGIDRVYLHTLRDDPPTKGAKTAAAFGLMRAVTVTGQPAAKPAFQALTMLLGILKTQPHVTRRAEGIYMLSGQKEPTYVLWKVASYDPSSFLIPGWWTIRSLNGQQVVRQGADIKLTYQPIFLQPTRSPFIQ